MSPNTKIHIAGLHNPPHAPRLSSTLSLRKGRCAAAGHPPAYPLRVKWVSQGWAVSRPPRKSGAPHHPPLCKRGAPHPSSPLCKRGARGDLAWGDLASRDLPLARAKWDLATVDSTMAALKPQHLPPQQHPEIAQ